MLHTKLENYREISKNLRSEGETSRADNVDELIDELAFVRDLLRAFVSTCSVPYPSGLAAVVHREERIQAACTVATEVCKRIDGTAGL